MLPERVESALDIKVAIESASTKLQKIGYNASHARNFLCGPVKDSEDFDVEGSDIRSSRPLGDHVATDLQVASNSRVQTFDEDMTVRPSL